MKSFWKYIISQQHLIYKSLLILSSSILILYLFPSGGQFKYEFQKGRAWQYPTYYAPFEFSILKSEAEIKADKEEALRSLKPYLRSDLSVKGAVLSRYSDEFNRFFSDIKNTIAYDSLYYFGEAVLNRIYEYGVLPPNYIHQGNTSILLIQDNIETTLTIDQLFKSDTLFEKLALWLSDSELLIYSEIFNNLFFELITPNVLPDKTFGQNAEKEALNGLSLSRGIILMDELII